MPNRESCEFLARKLGLTLDVSEGTVAAGLLAGIADANKHPVIPAFVVEIATHPAEELIGEFFASQDGLVMHAGALHGPIWEEVMQFLRAITLNSDSTLTLPE